jgi:hypothetical protein
MSYQNKRKKGNNKGLRKILSEYRRQKTEQTTKREQSIIFSGSRKEMRRTIITSNSYHNRDRK